jgi:hypothetical protein
MRHSELCIDCKAYSRKKCALDYEIVLRSRKNRPPEILYPTSGGTCRKCRTWDILIDELKKAGKSPAIMEDIMSERMKNQTYRIMLNKA